MAFGRLGSGGTGFGRLGSTGSGGGVAAPAGGAALLVGEANGFATDFLYATDAQRVAVKTAGTVVSSGTSFFTSSGTSSKWVYNAAGTLVNVPVGQLAIDYDPVTHAAKGLLVEPQATNYMFPSTPATGTWTVRGAATLTAGQVGPTGATTATLVAGVTGNSSDDFYRLADGLGTSLRTEPSFFIKRVSTSGTIQIQNVSAGPSLGRWNIDLALLGSGWERITRSHAAVTITAEFTSDAGGAGGLQFFRSAGASPLSFYIEFVQLEISTVATSPIPTTSATVTRAADAVKVTPASINYSAVAGSWWIDLTLNTTNATGQVIGYTTSGNTPCYPQAATTFAIYDSVAFVPKTVPSVLGSHKLGVAFASADRAITADGLAPATDATAGTTLLSPGSHIGFGCSPNAASLYSAHIRKLRYVPRRMTNGELQTETAP